MNFLEHPDNNPVNLIKDQEFWAIIDEKPYMQLKVDIIHVCILNLKAFAPIFSSSDRKILRDVFKYYFAEFTEVLNSSNCHDISVVSNWYLDIVVHSIL